MSLTGEETKQFAGTFAFLLEDHLSKIAIKRLSNSDLSPKALRLAHTDMLNLVTLIFKKSSHFDIDRMSVEWLTSQFFQAIKCTMPDGGEVLVRDLVVFNDHPLQALSFHDIELMRNLFSATSFGDKLDAEYKKRSAS